MMHDDAVWLRLVRAHDLPASNPHNDAYEFGLQDTKQVIVPGARQPDGSLVFDFTLRVKPGADADHPAFLGRFASGPVQDRFVYLSWWSIPRRLWINRVKARLGSISWAMVRAAQSADRPLVADMTGWEPGDPQRQVAWRLG